MRIRLHYWSRKIVKRVFPLIAILLIYSTVPAWAQENPTETDKHVFWQPDRIIGFDDFQGKATPAMLDKSEPHDIKSAAYVGLFSILDVPKKKKDRGKFLEKVYFAPAFDKSASYMLLKDTFELESQVLYFDIAETWARSARQQLRALEDSVGPAYGTRWLFFATIKRNMRDGYDAMIAAYTKEVLLDRVEGALDKWKTLVRGRLTESMTWATSPEECRRFVQNAPIDAGYIKSPDMAGEFQRTENRKR